MSGHNFKVGDKIQWKFKDEDWDNPSDVWQNKIYTVEDDIFAEGFIELGESGIDYRLVEPAGDNNNNVDHPSHYNQAGIECIEAIKATLGDNYQDYCKGNVLKYLWRYKYKNGIEDLKKAQWYLNSMIENLESRDD